MPDQNDQALDKSLQEIQKMQGLPAAMPTMSPEALAKIQTLLEQPHIKKIVALVSNPEFTIDLTNVIQHPQLKQCGCWEIGWMVAMIIFRSWMLSKATHWLKALWTSLWLIAIFWIVAAIGIPSYFLNPEYMKLIKDAWKLLG